MGKKDAKKLKVKVGKKALATVRDEDLARVSGGDPRSTVSPPPTAA